MASLTARRFLGLRSLSTFLRAQEGAWSSSVMSFYYSILPESSYPDRRPSNTALLFTSRSFCSHPGQRVDDAQVPAPIDYHSVLREDEFHKLADSTIHDLLEKLEEYGDRIDIDGFDIDYGNEVLTMKLGSQGTYVVNKQTPNRQIWLSSPVSGPSRYDWDPSTQAWVYRRNKATLFSVLESELQNLCGEPIKFS